MTSNKFTVVVADPCWSFSDKLKMSSVPRGAAANYDTMTTRDIIALPVKDIIDPDGAVLALWVPSSLLQEGLDTMKAWGFNHKQTYIWVKTKKQPLGGLLKDIFRDNKKIKFSEKLTELTEFLLDFSIHETLAFGMGRLFRNTHEICLIGTNNNDIYKKLNNKSQRTVSFGENLRHSAKPEHLQDALDIMFPDSGSRKIELFARRERPNWICLGDQAPLSLGEDIRHSLKKVLAVQDISKIDKQMWQKIEV